jgi:hypothetical protein
MEVDSFLDAMDYSFQHPHSPRNYATGRTTTTNFGRGEASFLVNTGMGAQIVTRTTPAHVGVAQGGETLAEATTKSSQADAAAGDSAMDIVEEIEKEEKGNEDDRLVTSSDGMELSSTEEEVNPPPPLHPPPPPPPPQQP